jgi:hypothetical protein
MTGNLPFQMLHCQGNPVINPFFPQTFSFLDKEVIIKHFLGFDDSKFEICF